MTEKQEKILHSALELFAKEGFSSTSTCKVAKHAGVSEGLIFRHFKNKDGLLDAILKMGEEKAKVLFAPVVFETEPKLVIAKIIDITLNLSHNEIDFEFWKLQYKIKWETEKYNEQKLEAVQMALANAFKKLGYTSPEEEALLLLLVIDGLATRLCLQKNFNPQGVINLLKEKYAV